MVEHPDFASQRLMQQLLHCGLLVQMEGLLSCFGDEIGMIEDMAVGMEDLSFVKLQFVQAESADDTGPTITMGRWVVGPILCFVPYFFLPKKNQYILWGVISQGFQGKVKSRFRETHIRSAKRTCSTAKNLVKKSLFSLQIVPN